MQLAGSKLLNLINHFHLLVEIHFKNLQRFEFSCDKSDNDNIIIITLTLNPNSINSLISQIKKR